MVLPYLRLPQLFVQGCDRHFHCQSINLCIHHSPSLLVLIACDYLPLPPPLVVVLELSIEGFLHQFGHWEFPCNHSVRRC